MFKKDLPAATGQPSPLLEADAVVIEAPAATGQPSPLLEADAVVIEAPAATGQPMLGKTPSP